MPPATMYCILVKLPGQGGVCVWVLTDRCVVPGWSGEHDKGG